MLASTFMDMVLGVDIHFEIVPMSPAPVPIPNPFVGMVFDPAGLLVSQAMGLAAALATGTPPLGPVMINGLPATTVGTEALNALGVPHIIMPPGVSWAPMPKAPKPTFKGPPPVPGPPVMPVRLPSSTVLAIPKGPLVLLIGGPPALSLGDAAGALLRSKWATTQRPQPDDGAAGRFAPEAGAFEAKLKRDALGLEIERALPGGVEARWQRDTLGRPVKQELLAGGSPAVHTRQSLSEPISAQLFESNKEGPDRGFFESNGGCRAPREYSPACARGRSARAGCAGGREYAIGHPRTVRCEHTPLDDGAETSLVNRVCDYMGEFELTDERGLHLQTIATEDNVVLGQMDVITGPLA